MRRQINLKKAHAQQGFTLLIVLVVLMVIAFLVVAATQTYNTELRISSNDADRKMAMTVAEQTLRTGEERVADILATGTGNQAASEASGGAGVTAVFKPECTNGLCASPGAEALTFNRIQIEANTGTVTPWETNGSCGAISCLDSAGTVVTIAGSGKASLSSNPRYVIEHLNTNVATGESYYRVTARSWGRNANTVVTVQSYLAG